MQQFKFMKFSANIEAGFGSLKNIGGHLKNIGITGTAAVISGETAFKIAGKIVVDSLESSGFYVNTFIYEKIEPTLKNAENLTAIIKNYSSKNDVFIIGIGGGSTLDVCKYISAKLELNFIAVPTLLSSDAIATGYSVLWIDDKNEAFQTKAPSLIVGDYEILKNQPKKYISAGVGDMLSKMSALYDWRLAFWLAGETYNDFAMNVAKATTNLLKKRIADVAAMNYIGIETLFLSEVTDGYLMQLSGTTRVAAGSEHLFTFALEKIHGMPNHGEYCGLGTIMMAYIQSKKDGEVRGYLNDVGAATTAADLDIKPQEIIKALTIAHTMRPWYTILGINGLSEGSAERLARYTMVI
ncbi:sn-glycerol-1-phosphate dehydrogenase [Acidiplasma sp.]|uniref:sn-glycerol-1-phosphate dehydrogenase n=3 Tax=Acidiplasma sp. TaxID=1872114 RepID=UPI00258CBDC7|nr:sn-glycerol-1-phosphate dehydrogenase [Acidiplasma sp.]